MYICANIQLLYEHLSFIEQEQSYIHGLLLTLERLGSLSGLDPDFDYALYREIQSKAETLERSIQDKKYLVEKMCQELTASKKFVQREIDEAEVAVRRLFQE